MGEVEKQDIRRFMGGQIIKDHIDTLDRRGDLRLNLIQEVNEILDRPAGIRRRHYLAAGRLESTEDIALSLRPSIVYLLLGPTSRLALLRLRRD